MNQWLLHTLTILASATVVSAAVYAALMLLTRHIQNRFLTPAVISFMMKAIRVPLAMVLLLVSFGGAASIIALPAPFDRVVPSALSVLQIAAAAWLAVRCTSVVREAVVNAYDITAKDNLTARKIHTQIRVVERILETLIILFAFAAILMTFDKVRQLGVSLLASAGVMGIILGFAAQKSIATLFAGIQIAMTQPIRVDDVVIVEGEWGRIEEITLTYVVVRIWDARRLIVPITMFLEKPFQNWTRVSADLLGSVFLYADYTVPVDAVRAELTRIVTSSPLWDGKVNVLQVTDSKASTVELRALVSARDSGTAWDLRCLVREKLIAFIQNNHPGALPRTRLEMNAGAK